jgi:hypothetical protein
MALNTVAAGFAAAVRLAAQALRFPRPGLL